MKLKGRPSPKMKSTYKEPLDEATIAAWKYLGYIVLLLFLVWLALKLPNNHSRVQIHQQAPPVIIGAHK